jgi:hypothetical protein
VTRARGLLHDEGLIDWGLLERLVKATPVSRNMVAGDFMWMGAVELVDGRRLHLYKNAMTLPGLEVCTQSSMTSHSAS